MNRYTHNDMSFDVDYTSMPLPPNSVEDMGIIDHPGDAANYGIADPNVGHTGSFNMQRDSDYVAWAST